MGTGENGTTENSSSNIYTWVIPSVARVCKSVEDPADSCLSHRILGLPVSFSVSSFSTMVCGIESAGKVELQVRVLGKLEL